MQLSAFENARDNDPTALELTWEQLCDSFKEHTFDHGFGSGDKDKEKAPCWSPAEYADGDKRSNVNVKRLHLAVLDADDLNDDEVDRLLTVAKRHRTFIYTTWRHSKAVKAGLHRLRLVFDLSRPVERSEWRRFYTRFVGMFEIPTLTKSALKCQDEARIYFEPYAPPGTEEDHWTHYLTGDPVDVDEILSRPAPLGARETPTSVPDIERITEGHLRALKASLGRSSNPTMQNALTVSKLALKGFALAEPGSRDDAIRDLCWAVAAEWPTADAESLVQTLERSLSVMAAQSGTDIEKEREKVRDKLTRAKEKQSRAQEERKEAAGNLELTETGKIANTYPNLQKILSRPEVQDTLRYNERARLHEIVRQPPWESQGPYPRPLKDVDGAHCTVYLADQCAFGNASPLSALQALKATAEGKPYDPVKEWLENLEPVEGGNLDTWLIRATGCEDTPYTRMVSRYSLLGAVARALYPGCVVKYVPVLIGEQNLGKSKLFRALAGAWFDESFPTDFEGKDAKAAAHNGSWIYEIQEIDKLSKRQAAAAKSFISTNTDRFRPAYAHTEGVYPRRCVFFASTNVYEFMWDETGNVRFQPITVRKQIEIPTPEEVESLWAEAYAAVAGGEKWWPENDSVARPVQEIHATNDPWEAIVSGILSVKPDPKGYGANTFSRKPWLEGQIDELGALKGIQCHQILETMKEEQSKANANRMGVVLRKLGWTKRAHALGKGITAYRPPMEYYEGLGIEREKVKWN